jgi:hypothetical protein
VPTEVPVLAARLSITSDRIATFSGMPLTAWSANQREEWDADIDALIARAYQLTRDEYEVVLDHFAPLHRAEDKQFGEYRSKRLRMESFDRLSKEAH